MIGPLASMVRKDLLRQWRAPLAPLVLLAFPLVFSVILALSFGTGPQRRPRIDLLVEDRDGGLATRLLVTAAAQGPLADVATVESVGPRGLERFGAGAADALLRVPPGFARDLVAGRPVALEVIRHPGRGAAAEVAEQALGLATEIVLAGTRLLAPAPGASVACPGGDDDCAPTPDEVAAAMAAVHESIVRYGAGRAHPLLRLEALPAGNAGTGPERRADTAAASVFLFVLPGVSVWALFALGDHGMRDVLSEAARGTLQRQLCAPITARQVVLGKAALSATLSLIGLAILSGIASVALERPVDLPAFALLSGALIAALSGCAALVYGLARTERQGATFSSAALLFLAFLGGSFVPVDSLPAAAQRLAPASPLYWATSGYRALIVDGAGVREVAPHAIVLAVLGLALLPLGSRLLERRVRSGWTP